MESLTASDSWTAVISAYWPRRRTGLVTRRGRPESQDILRVLRTLYSLNSVRGKRDLSEQDLLDQVYRRVTVYLCLRCYNVWIENPTG